MWPSVEGMLTICSNCSAPLNKMAAMPIYGKKDLKIFFSRTKTALRPNLGIQHPERMVYQVCPNVEIRMTLTVLPCGQICVLVAVTIL